MPYCPIVVEIIPDNPGLIFLSGMNSLKKIIFCLSAFGMSVFHVRYCSIKSKKVLMRPGINYHAEFVYPVKDEHCTVSRASEVTSVQTDIAQVPVACEA
jgi:hypothetical protein